MKGFRVLPILLFRCAGFAGGYGYARWYAYSTWVKAAGGEPRVLPRTPAVPETAKNLPMGTIEITPQKQQLIGVKYGLPSMDAPIKAIRAVGKVAPDEQRIAHVHTRVDGWIDEVFVDFAGKLVDKGQALLTLYSPDLLATQAEFLLAVKSKDLMKASTLESARNQGDSLI